MNNKSTFPQTSLRSEAKFIARNSGPLTAVYAADIGMYIVDMAIVGRVGPDELASVALTEQTIFFFSAILGAFFSLASIQVSKAISQEDFSKTSRLLSQTILLCFIFSIPFVFLSYNIGYVFEFAGLPPAIYISAHSYASTASWSIFPYLIFMILRYFAASFDRDNRAFFIVAAGIIANIPLSYSLTFGAYSFGGIGVAGTGLATTIVFSLMCIAIVADLHMRPPNASINLRLKQAIPERSFVKRLFLKGTPAAVTAMLEDGLFVVMGFFVGFLGPAALAAHAIANSVVNVGILFANGIGDATALRVASLHGRDNLQAARFAGFAGICLCLAPVAIVSIGMICAPNLLIQAFLGRDIEDAGTVIAITTTLLLIAAFSQIIEALQVATVRALRGLEDTAYPMIVAGVCYWGIALPVGLLSACPGRLGVHGMWLGLSLGLLLCALLSIRRFVKRTRHAQSPT